jgi:hypothetical protein
MNVAQFEALAQGGDPEDYLRDRMLDVIVRHAESFELPETAVGFRLTDTEAAERQIARLHAAVVAACGAEMATRVELAPEGSFPRLTLRLDGTLLPLERMRAEAEGDIDPETLEKLLAAASKLEVTLGVGIKQGYLVFIAASDARRLAALGSSRSLSERAEAVPLHKAADRPITAITYASEELIEGIGAGQRQIDDLVKLFRSMLPLAELGASLQSEVQGDLERFGEELKRYVPRPGAALAFTYMTPRGYEGWSYTWVENTLLDDSVPLSILEHVGGAPLFVVAFHGRQVMEQYNFTVRWLERAWHLARRAAEEKLDSSDQVLWQKLEPQMTALMEVIGRITRETIMPELTDGQCALVVDAKSSSRRWHRALSEAAEPLPMLEIALVHSLRDGERFGRGCEELFHATREGLLAAHRAAPDEIPEIELPYPSTLGAEATSIHYFPLPSEWGIDRKLAPSAGWTDGAVALSLGPDHVERLLRPAPFQDDGPISLCGRPLAAAACLDWTRLVDAARPWIDQAVDHAMRSDSSKEESGEAGDSAEAPEKSDAVEQATADENPAAAAIKDQIHQVLDIVRCFRGFRSATYFQQGVQVTHFECEFRDLELQR